MSLSVILGLPVGIDELVDKALSNAKVAAVLIVTGDNPGIIRIPHPPSDEKRVAEEFSTMLGGIRAVTSSPVDPTQSELVVAWMLRCVRRTLAQVGTKPLWDFSWDHGYLFLQDTGVAKIPGRNPPNVYAISIHDGKNTIRPFYVG